MTTKNTTFKYTPSRHATDRLKIRFGIAADKAAKWINDKMRNAKYVSSNGKNRLTYENDGVQIVVDDTTRVVITVHHAVTTSFLRPVLEREMRKLSREHTRLVRQIELDHAMTLRKYADNAVNYAKARNPKTRDLISGRMTELKAVADGYMARIERMEDEYDAKVRAVELIAE